MDRDIIVEQTDQVRRSLLAECGGQLDRLMDRMVAEAVGRQDRVASVEALDRLVPVTDVDVESILASGKPWRDPIVEEIARVRKALVEGTQPDPDAHGTGDVQPPSARAVPPRAKSA